MSKFNNSITDVDGIIVGHAQDEKALTGCTVVICEKGAVGGVDQRGGAPGTRETDLLRPMHLVEKINAVVLSGGSAFGLDSACGVMRYLEEKRIGFNAGNIRVPIVSAAIIFDLALGNAKIRPDADMGYQACLNASTEPPKQGNAGAGMGASVGGILGRGQAMKSGIGTASVDLGGGVIVAAIVVVNAFGDVINPKTNQIIAGTRSMIKGPIKVGSNRIFANTLDIMKSLMGRTAMSFAMKQNSIIGVVSTNAILNKEQSNKVAQMAQNGIAMTIRPAHSMLDGDTIFCMATGKHKADVNLIGAYAAEMVAQSIVNAVLNAEPAANLPSAKSIKS